MISKMVQFFQWLLHNFDILRHQNEQNTKVKVEKAGKSVLDWYAINVSPDQNFSHIFEAISQASTHALNVSLFKEPVRLDDFKDGRIFIVQDISEDKNKIESGWSLSVADCEKFWFQSHLVWHGIKNISNIKVLFEFKI